jgi:hypothetical protein
MSSLESSGGASLAVGLALALAVGLALALAVALGLREVVLDPGKVALLGDQPGD